MKIFKRIIFINLILSLVFSILSFPFGFDISMIALPLSLLFSLVCGYFVIIKFIKEEKIKIINTVRRFYQYQPFVLLTSFILQRAGKRGSIFLFDLFLVLLWVTVTLLSFAILYFLNEKRVYSLNEKWVEYHEINPVQKQHGIKRIGIEIFEWVDALVQAIFTVMILNIFLFQLYEIPSESMVPEFLVKDRVAVFKTFSGPKFPLSEVGIPYLKDYKRGDIVVLRNPHYSNDRKSEVKTFFSNFVYMATLTLVNLNKDENGELKADPLVKRLVGLPGEQLMMMDGTLYSRTKEFDEFKIIEEDKKWAAWDLNNQDQKIKSKIEWIPMKENDVQDTLDIEEKRREFDFVSASIECEYIVKEFSKYTVGKKSIGNEYLKLFSNDQMFAFNLIDNINDNTIKLLSAEGGAEWFAHFMTSWKDNLDLPLSEYKEIDNNGKIITIGKSLVGGNLYTDSNFRLNVMTKLIFGRLILRNAELISNNTPVTMWTKDLKRVEAFNRARALCNYIIRLDQRNMPIFPANNSHGEAVFIPEHNYFMMGDNRYNSLDMRHSYENKFVPLTDKDIFSVTYYSNMEPQYVNRSRMLGKASYRFWPLNRAGVPGKSIRK